MLAPVRISAPVATPVSVSEAKAHLRVDDTNSDTLIQSMIDAAVAHLDGWAGILGRCLVTQSWRQDYPAFASRLRLPLGPVATISSITYYDADNASQTLASAVYTHLTDATGTYVTLKPDQEWPATYRRPEAVSITYVAGTSATDVPAAIKQAILLLVGAWYENREETVTGTTAAQLPDSVAVRALLAPYRKVGV